MKWQHKEQEQEVLLANFSATVHQLRHQHQQLVRILLRQVKELKTYLPNRGVLISLLEKPQ
jgi:hypothetical protein